MLLLIFEVMTFVLLFIQNIRYEIFGYHINILLTLLSFPFIFIAIGWLLFSKKNNHPYVLMIAIISYGIVNIISILSFPLNSERSDMLPLIVEGGKNLAEGISPYTFYNIPQLLTMTYLPGLWLSYLPAALLNFDPRIINSLCIIGDVLILYWSARNRENIALLLSIFLLNPYLQYRHEIYLGVLFLAIAMSYRFLMRRQNVVSSIFYGVAMSMYQFMWVMFPFSILYIYKRSVAKTAITSL